MPSKITGRSLLDADFLLLLLGLAISFAMLEVLSYAKKVSLYPKASQQPAKTGIKRGKHCYVLLDSRRGRSQGK